MTGVVKYAPAPAKHINLTIEQLLAELDRYAFVSVRNYADDETWSATADMRIKTKGATFKVDSGFKHATAKNALAVLLELVENTMRELGNR